ncbi:LINE-1 retrotransposable element ORF2 protein isoform X2 [Bactrocera dorsalis]|uniref:LINE-1 retrotransposable element ORF2 protein isoform X2 n=1 Tax=Bactrocera dorsalis TaxID=27457 RepID=A0ABM3JA11_BACDO|nr:LINE-1 retrotransposable element ORF2 protein isoform X2 [Bactrocera dorsalis]
MHQLLCKIWSDESMPNDWNLSVLCPIHKKGDPTICANYRGISLLNIAYKVLSNVLCERLKPTVNKLIGPYQCGFRPGKSTTDQIFTMRQILEKTRERRIDTHHLFVDFKTAFDSTKRSCLYAAMSEFGIPAKLIRLCKLALSNTKSSVRVGKDLSEPPYLNSSAGNPSAPAALLFFSRAIAIRTSSWSGNGTPAPSSSIGVSGSPSPGVVRTQPFSRLEKCSLHNLSVLWASVARSPWGVLQEYAPVLIPSVSIRSRTCCGRSYLCEVSCLFSLRCVTAHLIVPAILLHFPKTHGFGCSCT